MNLANSSAEAPNQNTIETLKDIQSRVDDISDALAIITASHLANSEHLRSAAKVVQREADKTSLAIQNALKNSNQTPNQNAE
ncbi:MAG: hypothetical protein GVY30_01020 [Chloroflexi bacterium]|jgi:L-asparaginase II|nr:hypothetical protein [Chloroflexota bacterium]